MDVSTASRWTDVVFGLAGHAVLLRQAAPTRQEARRLQRPRVALAHAPGPAPPPSRRLDDACVSAAGSWARSWRVVRQAKGRQADEPPRCVGPSLTAPTPQRRYANLYGARGTCAQAIKAVQHALPSDRTAAPPCLAHARRLLLAWAAAGLPHALRTPTLRHPALAQAQPATVLLPLCKLAAQITQDKDRMLLHWPSAWPVKAL